MSKALDRVEWLFIDLMLRRLGFSNRWYRIISDCISLPTYAFNINGATVGHVVFQRGLRQGYPFSLYLSLICAEGLSSFFWKASLNGSLMGFASGLRGPHIHHLFFADESLIFFRAKIEDVATLRPILYCYVVVSGQIDVGSRNEFRNLLDISMSAILDTYLGLTHLVGWKKKTVFQSICDKLDPISPRGGVDFSLKSREKPWSRWSLSLSQPTRWVS